MKRTALSSAAAMAFLLWLVVMLGSSFAQEWKKLRDEGANFYDIQRNFYQHYQEKAPGQVKEDAFEGEGEGGGYTQFKRWEYWMAPRVYPGGVLPAPDQEARAFSDYLQSRGVFMEGAVFPAYSPAAIPAANWTSLGPIHWVTTSATAPGLGRISAIAFHPTDPNTIYLGTPAGGLWKTTDGGLTWSTNTDNLAVLGVSSIVFDPNNANIMYMASGDNDADHTPSLGVLKSTDGGATWNTTGLNWQASETKRIYKLLMHPTNSNILLAATSDGLYKTTDGGANWSRKLTSTWKDIEFKPGDPTVVYAAWYTKLYRSTNTGDNWTSISLPSSAMNRFSIAVTPANANYVYVLAGKSADNSFLGLYRSTDSGLTWTVRSTTPNILGYEVDGSDATRGQSFYDLALAVSPTNANDIYTGGVNIWRSTDGGATWINRTSWKVYINPAAYVHADVHHLEFNNGVLYTGTDGGFFKSTDNGLTWTDLSAGMNITQYYRMGGDPNNINLIYGGAQDNTITRYNGAGIWDSFISGDGGECVVDPTNSNIVYWAVQKGSLYRTSNAGVSYSSIKNNIDEDGAWVTPYVMDPATNTTLYAGYVNVWKTTNSGSSWSKLSNFASTATMADLQVAPSDPNHIYAAKTANIYRTTNGGTSWSEITSGLPTGAYTQVAVSDNNPQKIWITLSGYQDGKKVYASTDGGSTWTNYSGSLPNLPFNTIVYHNNGGNDALYAGADVGVYYRDAAMADWELYQTGLPNVPINELEVHQNSGKLRAATFGRGMWETDLVPAVVPGAALAFDGVDDYVSMPAPLSPSAPYYTMEAWVKWNGSTGNSQVIFYNGNTGTDGYGIVLHNDEISALLGGVSFFDTGVSLSVGTWTHLALARVGPTTWRIWKDGVFIFSFNGTNNTPTTGAGIGASFQVPLDYFNGSIDEVRFWTDRLTVTEIVASMNCELTGTETDLAAYYQFNQGQAGQDNTGVTTLTDIVGGNNGTLHNFTLTGTTSNWVAPGAVPSGVPCVAAAPLAANAGGDHPHSGGATKLNGSASGGGGAYTYTWAVQSGPNVSSAQFSNASAQDPVFTPSATGAYQLRLTINDGMNPPASDETDVIVNTLFTVSISGDDPVDPGSLHSYTVTTDAGNPTFLWSATNGTITEEVIQNPPPGGGANTQNPVLVEAGTPQSDMLLEVYVTDGVTSDVVYALKSISLNNPLALSANAGADRTIPVGASTTLGGSPAANGGVSPFTYQWEPTTGLNNPNAANPLAQPVTTTTYTLTVTDGYSTVATDQVTVTVTTINNAYGNLLGFIDGLDIDKGLKNALSSKIKNSQKSYQKGNINAAINQLEAFINQVEAQRGKKLTNEQADALIAHAEALIEAINASGDQGLPKEPGTGIPETYALEQNYPNPFNPTTTIRFSLPEAVSVTLRIYNSTGQLVKTLANGNMEAGYHSLSWDATNENGVGVASGFYFYKLQAGKFIQIRKMLLLK